jgi:hypothetical protein
MKSIITPWVRIFSLFGGTFVAWGILVVGPSLALDFSLGFAAALNVSTFLFGIWTPPPPWPPDWSRRIAIGVGAVVSAFSCFFLVFGWAWAGAHSHR